MQVLFLCPHSAAKSVIATAMLRDLADRLSSDVTCDNAGTDPDSAVNPIAMDALARRGLTYEGAPRLVTAADIDRAEVVVSFGCGLEDLPSTPRRWVDWSDVTDASVDAERLCDQLVERLPTLL